MIRQKNIIERIFIFVIGSILAGLIWKYYFVDKSEIVVNIGISKNILPHYERVADFEKVKSFSQLVTMEVINNGEIQAEDIFISLPDCDTNISLIKQGFDQIILEDENVINIEKISPKDTFIVCIWTSSFPNFDKIKIRHKNGVGQVIANNQIYTKSNLIYLPFLIGVLLCLLFIFLLRILIRLIKICRTKIAFSRIFAGSWKCGWITPNQQRGEELFQIKNGNLYCVNNTPIFKIDQILIDKQNDLIRFRRVGLRSSDNRILVAVLFGINNDTKTGYQSNEHTLIFSKQ